MFGYFFGYNEVVDNEVVDNEIQPSYRTTRQRHLVMKQIRESKVKLKKTFIVHEYEAIGYASRCQYRQVGIKKERT